MRVTAITHRKDPLYLSTYTGRPPDEPSVIGEVFNRLSLPVIKAQIPEVRDLWLPPAACSYRMAVISIDKRYPGQARRVMMGLWGMLPQFSYTKMIVVVDDDIDPRKTFFEHGGDSLTILRVRQNIRKRLAIDISIDDLFKNPTIAALAERIRQLQKGG